MGWGNVQHGGHKKESLRWKIAGTRREFRVSGLFSLNGWGYFETGKIEFVLKDLELLVVKNFWPEARKLNFGDPGNGRKSWSKPFVWIFVGIRLTFSSSVWRRQTQPGIRISKELRKLAEGWAQRRTAAGCTEWDSMRTSGLNLSLS